MKTLLIALTVIASFSVSASDLLYGAGNNSDVLIYGNQSAPINQQYNSNINNSNTLGGVNNNSYDTSPSTNSHNSGWQPVQVPQVDVYNPNTIKNNNNNYGW